MQSPPAERKRSLLNLAMLAGVAVLLVAVVLATRSVRDSSDADPLYPTDSMAAWRTAGEAKKHATAAALLEVLRTERRIGARTADALESPVAQRALVNELIAGLDEATDRNQKAYVSPSQSILRTAEVVANRAGWDQ